MKIGLFKNNGSYDFFFFLQASVFIKLKRKNTLYFLWIMIPRILYCETRTVFSYLDYRNFPFH